MIQSYKFEIFGLVQGVGFRPFVYSLAIKHNLFGNVYNDDSGVKISIYGDENNIKIFEKDLVKKLPPLARIDDIKKYKIDEKFDKFEIIESKQAKKMSPILPDFALCKDCEREFFDPTNHRFNYPFINCTNCGPRFSIIQSLPYDRKNTTMSVFKMCKTCESEYTNPLDRRYHAQPISCPDCGPRLMLKDKDKNILSIDEKAIKTACNLINNGKILAIKGLGGFHLVCNAFDENVVNKLREKKHRPHKPFAIMSKNIGSAKQNAHISKDEEELLISNLKPIVLLKTKKQTKIAKSVAPNLNKIGLMLPFSGIHLALFKYLKCDIIATSANISSQPVICKEDQLLNSLSDVIDFYLDHDREIFSPSDDSIGFVNNKKTFFTRTSRGLNPNFINTNSNKKGVFLALGAELKNQFAIYNNGTIIISPYIGDLKNVATFDRFLDVLNLFQSTYELKFDEVIADLHPQFLNLKYAKSKQYKITQIQHHYAHLLSVILENNLSLDKKYLGFCFDGTGFGDDGKIWGGEVFEINGKNYNRLYHFDEFLLLGGESSIKNIYKLALSVIFKYDIEVEAREFLNQFDSKTIKNLKLISKNNQSSIKTSSLGRIFDAFACIVLDIKNISYEAQTGMELEKFYDENLDFSYEFKLDDGIINFKDAFLGALKDDKTKASTGFINGVANLMCKIAIKEDLEVIFSGGVFQNSILLNAIHNKFKHHNIKYYENSKFCSNDSNICLGQIQYLLI
ncbi:carbamoyltransferase HypF [Campylobacter pinnipediorum]|uniref:carbamoyltransferase HypF n=1 Tax=Campylobacter pinnipediorum TaxID=1965231 RepID=UPI00084DF04C|nr:carbamoyltransferase HypF [Campylobacter pinnipediorum]